MVHQRPTSASFKFGPILIITAPPPVSFRIAGELSPFFSCGPHERAFTVVEHFCRYSNPRVQEPLRDDMERLREGPGQMLRLRPGDSEGDRAEERSTIHRYCTPNPSTARLSAAWVSGRRSLGPRF